MKRYLSALSLVSALIPTVVGGFFWPDVTNVFSFGDSYTDTYARLTDGKLSPPQDSKTTAGGPMWIEYLTSTYNVSHVNLFNFASISIIFIISYGGAVTDQNIIAQSSSATQSFRDQVNNFLEYYANNSSLAQWNKNNTLFTIFFGINDIGKSFYWTNETVHRTNARVLASYFEGLSLLRDAGAASFLLLEVPNVGRTPDLLKQGNNATLQARAADDYNKQLASHVSEFRQNSTRAGVDVNINIHSTNAFFDFILDNSGILGFENVTGLSNEAQYSTATYFWWNNFHPTWGVHEVAATTLHGLLTSVVLLGHNYRELTVAQQ
ncbi:hypothetical protein PUNSTDRAFT_43146 [Punctularia strigosozonata HHB-11173 SS5]|uniref:uncharacterized protein n=1 Tax=Punctularia strigosozonata (strain HHB-11173) TaxID=741275 RepID=UPI00044178A7|nr:uncharacterized protein PUNSTDRAFT_43146 [Punctularia strigosozonata HHB-11173 SS5]EIN12103.1 hypothetical protein PUNSTDRAFT_43146 [Punctularia strigosozonata HHB-11173 SS5]